MNTTMTTGLAKFMGMLLLSGSSAAWALSSPIVPESTFAPPRAAAAPDRSLPTHGTTHDADGKILAFSMPILIEVEHSGNGNTILVRAVRAESGDGMTMEVVGEIPSSATGTYSGLLPVSFDYN